MDIIRRIAEYFPHLKEELRKAHMKLKPEDFVKRALKNSLVFAGGMTIFSFFMLAVFGKPLVFLVLIFPALFFILFLFVMMEPQHIAAKRQKELDKEVLFAGRFLLIKVLSGRPLLNALIDASQSYGVASFYFREMVEEINLGTPIEDAIDNAIKYSPSDKFRRILFHINNAIKIGIDVRTTLESAIDEIANEQLNDIRRYGKKLNSLALFYMLLAIVLPSLGMAMFAVIGGLLGLQLTMNIYFLVLFFLLILQVCFMIIFKSSRLTVNI